MSSLQNMLLSHKNYFNNQASTKQICSGISNGKDGKHQFTSSFEKLNTLLISSSLQITSIKIMEEIKIFFIKLIEDCMQIHIHKRYGANDMCSS